MAEELFEHEINNISKSRWKYVKNDFELYHGLKAEISKRFNLSTSVILSHYQEGKSAIVV